MRNVGLLVLVSVLVLVVGCGDDGTPSGDGGRTDGSRLDGSIELDGSGLDGAGADAGTVADGGGAGEDAAVVPPARARLMYVSLHSMSSIAMVELGADGTMTRQVDHDAMLPGSPGAMAYARTARRLYVGVDGGNGRIATLDLDADGWPSVTGTTENTGFPVYLSIGHDDNVLVSAYFDDDRLRTHDVAGAPPHERKDQMATDDEPHSAVIHPLPVSATIRRLYVTHRNGQVTRWYTLAADGTLTFESQLAAEEGAGPRHIAFNADGSRAYIVNEFGDSISAHRVMADGSLERFQTISTLPDGVSGATSDAADVHVTPNGRFVYASNRGHDSIAMFSANADGELTFLGTEPTAAVPREFDISPDGRFLVAAGQESGFLHSYRIGDDGMLAAVDRLEVGADLRWVIID